MYVKIEDGEIARYPYTMANFLDDNPNTSFPVNPPNSLLSEWGVYPVRTLDKPNFDNSTQKLKLHTDISFVDGEWTLGWDILDKSTEELENEQSKIVKFYRSERDRFLKESDWTQLPDAPVNAAAWASYRQELRDITDQEGFPENTIWPDPPV